MMSKWGVLVERAWQLNIPALVVVNRRVFVPQKKSTQPTTETQQPPPPKRVNRKYLAVRRDIDGMYRDHLIEIIQFGFDNLRPLPFNLMGIPESHQEMAVRIAVHMLFVRLCERIKTDTEIQTKRKNTVRPTSTIDPNSLMTQGHATGQNISYVPDLKKTGRVIAKPEEVLETPLTAKQCGEGMLCQMLSRSFALFDNLSAPLANILVHEFITVITMSEESSPTAAIIGCKVIRGLLEAKKRQPDTGPTHLQKQIDGILYSALRLDNRWADCIQLATNWCSDPTTRAIHSRYNPSLFARTVLYDYAHKVISLHNKLEAATMLCNEVYPFDKDNTTTLRVAVNFFIEAGDYTQAKEWLDVLMKDVIRLDAMVREREDLTASIWKAWEAEKDLVHSVRALYFQAVSVEKAALQCLEEK